MPFINKETSYTVSTPNTLPKHRKYSNNISNNNSTNIIRQFHSNRHPRVYLWHVYCGGSSCSCKPSYKWPNKSQPTSRAPSPASSRSLSPILQYSEN